MFERIATGLVCGMSLLACASVAQAQTSFPNRPITMVVPLPAGGTADLLCRFAAEKASSLLGQQIVIENRAGGAGGRVGTESVLRSPPDGYTILCAPQLTYSITHLVFTKAAFDTRAMEPISVLATYPLIVLARVGLPANNMPEFLAYAQANPGKVNYGHQGKGNTGHLLGELLMLKGNFRMTEIPYRGSAPAINDLLAGNIDIVPDYLLANKQNIDAGKLKILGTGGRERLKDYPNVATLAETLRASMPIPGWAWPLLPVRRRRSSRKSRTRSDRRSSRRICAPVSWPWRPSLLAARRSRCATSSRRARSNGGRWCRRPRSPSNNHK